MLIKQDKVKGKVCATAIAAISARNGNLLPSRSRIKQNVLTLSRDNFTNILLAAFTW
jgi:hypothetical protein